MIEDFGRETFDYDDVILVPEQCVVGSRSEIDTSVSFGGRLFRLPVVPANMSSVIDEALAVKLSDNGYFYVMHRFDVDPIVFTEKMHSQELFSSISLGVQEIDHKHVENLSKLDRNPEYITIDIAHGDTDRVYRIVEKISSKLPETFIIAGNVATGESVRRLEDAGAGAAKVGIGPGFACTTAPNTGFGTRGWQLSAVQYCAEAATSAVIIADGGIREYGDIAKSVAFGADMVMIGGMFAGHDESPGETIEENGETFKKFFGSASSEQKGDDKNVEGRSMLVASRGPIDNTLRIIEENLQSSVSYAGGKELSALRSVKYSRVNNLNR